MKFLFYRNIIQGTFLIHIKGNSYIYGYGAVLIKSWKISLSIIPIPDCYKFVKFLFYRNIIQGTLFIHTQVNNYIAMVLCQ